MKPFKNLNLNMYICNIISRDIKRFSEENSSVSIASESNIIRIKYAIEQVFIFFVFVAEE